MRQWWPSQWGTTATSIEISKAYEGKQSHFSNELCQIQNKQKKSISSTTGVFNKDNPLVVHVTRNNLNTKIMKQNQDSSKKANIFIFLFIYIKVIK